MSDRDYKRGHRDGENGEDNPPHDRDWVQRLIAPWSDEEKEDREDYEDGRRHGEKSKE